MFFSFCKHLYLTTEETSQKYGRMMLNYRSSFVNPDFCMRFVSDSLCTCGQYHTSGTVFVNLAIGAEGLTFHDSPGGTLKIFFLFF